MNSLKEFADTQVCRLLADTFNVFALELLAGLENIPLPSNEE